MAVNLPALTLVEAPPATVTQHTSEKHFGLPPEVFKRLCADGRLPAKRLGRTWVVGYEEGRRALTERPVREVVALPAPPEAPAPPDEGDDEGEGAYASAILAGVRARDARKAAKRGA